MKVMKLCFVCAVFLLSVSVCEWFLFYPPQNLLPHQPLPSFSLQAYNPAVILCLSTLYYGPSHHHLQCKHLLIAEPKHGANCFYREKTARERTHMDTLSSNCAQIKTSSHVRFTVVVNSPGRKTHTHTNTSLVITEINDYLATINTLTVCPKSNKGAFSNFDVF